MRISISPHRYQFIENEEVIDECSNAMDFVMALTGLSLEEIESIENKTEVISELLDIINSMQENESRLQEEIITLRSVVDDVQ